MKRTLTGNLILPDRGVFGELSIENGLIAAINIIDEKFRDGYDLIIPGFIDLHFHGLAHFGVNESIDALRGIAKFAPQTGVTGICPSLASAPWELMIGFLKNTARLIHSGTPGAHLLGSHMEGPFIIPSHRGGMDAQYLLPAEMDALEKLLDAADGTMRLITVSPELPGICGLIRRLRQEGVTVSAGHTGCTPEQFADAVDAGIGQVCHIFDTFDGRVIKNGVTQVSLADAAILDDRVMVECITDGFHVPPPLIELLHRCAGSDRIIGITDCMEGTGLPDGDYLMPGGRRYHLTNNEVCRLIDSASIVGSCLTMDTAFRNLTKRFGFSPVEASRVLSGNPARSLGLARVTGSLDTGLQADITILSAAEHRVRECIVNGNTAYAVNGELK